jgi:dTDP-4-amino-4,6-dideoxygalactose transaminase
MPILSSGANVIWADIDPATGTLDPESVKSKITPKTKVIFHNHHCGYPGYIDEINAIGKEKGIIVIDDCIEAFGSEYKGKKMGSLDTDVTLFSFQTVRLPNTIDGGAVCFKDKELHQQVCKLRDLGVDRTTFRDNLGEISALSDVPKIGMGVTMNEVSSYIGSQQMQEISDLLAQQRLNGKAWKTKLEQDFNYKGVSAGRDIDPNYWVNGMLYAKGRVAGMEHFRKLGYSASTVHLPNNRYSVFGNTNEVLKGVEEFYNHFIAVPSGWWVKKHEV